MQSLCRNRRMHEGKRFREVLQLRQCYKNSVASLGLPGTTAFKFLMVGRRGEGGAGGGGEGVLLRILGKSWSNFRPKKHAILHTRFQTWPLKSISVFRPLLNRN